MKPLLLSIFLLTSFSLLAQSPDSPFSGNHWGVVLEIPAMNDVVQKKDITFFKDDRVDLKMDMYLPPKMKSGEKLPVIVFMNGFGENSMRANGIYKSWPKLVATQGFIGVSMDSDSERLGESYNALFDFLGKQDHVDGNRIGVYAASANARRVVPYLMGSTAHQGVKAAAIYYGETPPLPYRKDLPVHFIVAELDTRHTNYSTLWSNILESKAPWTITMASTMPHAFDAFADNDISKKLVLETLAFWKTHLNPLPVTSSRPSMAREVIAMEYQGNFPRVITLMREWLKANPDTKDAAAYRALGNALMKQGEYADAEQAYVKSFAFDPDNRGSMLNMVIISYTLDKPAEAKRWLEKYEMGEKPEGFTYSYVARHIMGKQKYDEAIVNFQKSIEMGPHPSDYYNLAICYLTKNNVDLAFENLFNAAEKGFNARSQYEKEEAFKALRTDKRWDELDSKLR